MNDIGQKRIGEGIPLQRTLDTANPPLDGQVMVVPSSTCDTDPHSCRISIASPHQCFCHTERMGLSRARIQEAMA